MQPATEKTILQICVLLACAVPLFAGTAGMWQGASLLNGNSLALDSHFRYLSGLLLGIGLAFITTVPKIETQELKMRLLTGIVVIGGLGRLAGFALEGVPPLPMQLALGMECIVTPLLCAWQYRVARRYKNGA